MHGFISGLSIFFHWSTFLFLCQYHMVLMTLALQYNLKSGRLIPPAPILFLETALAILGLLCFHMNCENFCSSFVEKMPLVFDRDHIESVDCVWQYNHFHKIDSSYPGTWNVSPSIYIVFDFFHQCLIIFCIQFSFSPQISLFLDISFCCNGEWD